MSRKERREREEQEEKQRKKEQKSKNKNKLKKEDTPKKQKKKEGFFKKLIKAIFKTILILILLIVLLAGSFVAYLGFTNNWNWNKMLRRGARQVALIATGQTEEDLKNLDPIYCLILGVSTSEKGSEKNPLTDTMIVAAYYPRTQQASMLSIPRDTFVGKSKATANSYDKINAIYARRGIEGLMTEVEKLTGLDINNYVIVKNAGLIEVVDAIGGVEFNVPCNMKYDDGEQKLHINLKKGLQRLNGQQAEGLVRFRKNNDGTGYPAEWGHDDFGRMRTQKEFIAETIKQTLKFANISKVNELIEIAYRNIETNVDMNYVMKYAPAALEFDVSALQSASLDGTTPRYGKDQLYFFEPYPEKKKKLIQDLFIFNQEQYDAGVSEIPIKPENIKIQLLNASGDEKILEDTKERLENKGYNIKETGTTTIAKTTKVINRTEKKVEVVDELVDALGYGDEAKGQTSDEYDFTVVIGQDMKMYVTET